MPWLGILGISHIICGLQCVHVCFHWQISLQLWNETKQFKENEDNKQQGSSKRKRKNSFFCTMTYSYSEYWAVLHPGFLHCLLWINTLYEALFGTHEYGAPCRWEEWRVYNSVLLMRLPIAENEPTLLG